MDLLVIGLGNPGSRYSQTRHNIGFEVADAVSNKLGLSWKKKFLHPYLYAADDSVFLVKPLTYMNRSGVIVPSAMKKSGFSIENFLVVCDTLDLKPGMCRLKLKGGDAGHRGLQSIIATLGTNEVMRLYIGIGRPVNKDDVIDYVLSRPPTAEKQLYDHAVETAANGIIALQNQTPHQVMNEINAK